MELDLNNYVGEYINAEDLEKIGNEWAIINLKEATFDDTKKAQVEIHNAK